ncbi:hypothetical protein MADA3029_p0121 [Vibrio nigripulchritudo MADA3029]|uniref:hypothetical protein n=1 Tax=Vibrio nigripulchritudo TaxID=28173 RepID=UPI0003B185AA|nr:hypothetical protein [Vibrio nigripulchritudo]CCN38729.1 hypothetical protein VIBNIAM115_p0145 [Vibrio nigripulchritudo AM115]CCN45036.1 hypothetical protein VIBNIFTn2_p0144 [Vibrio nigripulchritudo FTn2]CCN50880.1 hypothetical protein VIBNIMADA3020_p0121 [Vibrio nigripulchritudo MADA3020]CCN56738.1 hypothetical protein VIBNIMADA3021_p0121 [Vibrio nigripulchritudo MADA3021]CCN62595.1 hypothetical protein MADA3029_p0121 [Vibrio nigripulchritudo MADA3029]
MIVFDISSACAISQLFKKGAVQAPMDFFLEDGGKRYRLTDVKELREEFEGDGMFQSVFLGYRLTFNGGCTVKIDAIKSIATLTLPDNNPVNTLDRESFDPNNVKDWTKAGINKFLF